MPYIPKETRRAMASSLGDLNAQIKTIGDLTYVVYKLARLFIGKDELNFQAINQVLGMFSSAQLEFWWRTQRPYEEVKIIENGDIS